MNSFKPFQTPDAYRHLVFDILDSTNSEAQRQACAGADEGLWIIANRQEQGRGRRGRVWASETGNLFASLLIRPKCSPNLAALIGFVAALSIHDAIAHLVGNRHDVRVKWPNDVLVDGQKISGILLESSVSKSGLVDYLVVGIGINIAQAPQLPHYPATSLKDLGVLVDRDTFMHRLFDHFANRYSQYAAHGFSSVREDWLLRCAHIDQRLHIINGNQQISGLFKDIDENGALILDVEGELRHIHAGDVFPMGQG